ncbi:hypothetical protein FRC09_016169, partial [Ceratobasidium sp. 395]
ESGGGCTPSCQAEHAGYRQFLFAQGVGRDATHVEAGAAPVKPEAGGAGGAGGSGKEQVVKHGGAFALGIVWAAYDRVFGGKQLEFD